MQSDLAPQASGQSHLEKSEAFGVTLPWRGRVGTRSSEARCVTGWGDLSAGTPLMMDRLSPHPARSLRERATLPLQGRVAIHTADLSYPPPYAIALPQAGEVKALKSSDYTRPPPDGCAAPSPSPRTCRACAARRRGSRPRPPVPACWMR